MSTSTENITPATEASARLQRAIEEAKNLQTLERIIAGVERAVLHRVVESYDTTKAIEATRALNIAVRSNDDALTSSFQEQLTDELHLWRVNIAQRDDEVMAYNLRRFCEHADGQLDAHSYAALTRFYRSRCNTSVTQSKYDLVVTRLCAPVNKRGARSLRMNRQQLADRLTTMFAAWDAASANGSASLSSVRYDATSETEAITRGFDAFIEEADQIMTIEGLVHADLFNRVRDFKSSLGDTFYEPAATAAAIECNVALTNKFATLLDAEGEQIRDAPSACRELAEVFSDPTCEAPANELAILLSNWQAQDDDSEGTTQARERLFKLGELLRLTCDTSRNGEERAHLRDENSDANPEDTGAHNDLSEMRGIIGEARYCELMSSLGQPWRSPEVRAIDLSLFVRPLVSNTAEEQSEKKFSEDSRMEALLLIMEADDVLRCEMQNERDIDATLESRLIVLLKRFATTDEELSRLRTQAWQQRIREDADALLYIANQLHQARLGLQAAIVGRSANELARQKAQTVTATQPQMEMPEETKRAETPAVSNVVVASFGKRVLPSGRSRMLAAAVVVLLIACGAFSHYNGTSASASIKPDAEVVKINRLELPNSHLFEEVRQRREVLVGMVSKEWERLVEDEQYNAMRSILEYGKDKGIKSLMLINNQGIPVGSASDDQVTLASELASKE